MIVQTTGVGAHNSLGFVERYHANCWRMFDKIKHENPEMGCKIALLISVKAMNDTMRSNVLVPSYLVIYYVPRFWM